MMSSSFFVMICDDLSIYDVEMNISKTFWNLQNDRYIDAKANFLSEVVRT